MLKNLLTKIAYVLTVLILAAAVFGLGAAAVNFPAVKGHVIGWLDDSSPDETDNLNKLALNEEKGPTPGAKASDSEIPPWSVTPDSAQLIWGGHGGAAGSSNKIGEEWEPLLELRDALKRDRLGSAEEALRRLREDLPTNFSGWEWAVTARLVDLKLLEEEPRDTPAEKTGTEPRASAGVQPTVHSDSGSKGNLGETPEEPVAGDKELPSDQPNVGRQELESRRCKLEDDLYTRVKESPGFAMEAREASEFLDGGLYRKYVASLVKRKELKLNTFGKPLAGSGSDERAAEYLDFAKLVERLASKDDGLWEDSPLLSLARELGEGGGVYRHMGQVRKAPKKQRLLFEVLMARNEAGGLDQPNDDTLLALVDFMDLPSDVLSEYEDSDPSLLTAAAKTARRGLKGDGPLGFLQSARLIDRADLWDDLHLWERLLVQGFLPEEGFRDESRFDERFLSDVLDRPEHSKKYWAWVLGKADRLNSLPVPSSEVESVDKHREKFGKVISSALNDQAHTDWAEVIPLEWVEPNRKDIFDDSKMNEWWDSERTSFLRGDSEVVGEEPDVAIRGLIARYVWEKKHGSYPEGPDPKRWLAVAVMSFGKSDDYFAACNIWDNLHNEKDRCKSVREAIKLSEYKDLRGDNEK